MRMGLKSKCERQVFSVFHFFNQLPLVFCGLGLSSCRAEDFDSEADNDGEGVTPRVDMDLGAGREGSRTDDGVVQREEEAIKIDGLNVAQVKELRDKAEKFQFQVITYNKSINKI